MSQPQQTQPPPNSNSGGSGGSGSSSPGITNYITNNNNNNSNSSSNNNNSSSNVFARNNNNNNLTLPPNLPSNFTLPPNLPANLGNNILNNNNNGGSTAQQQIMPDDLANLLESVILNRETIPPNVNLSNYGITPDDVTDMQDMASQIDFDPSLIDNLKNGGDIDIGKILTPGGVSSGNTNGTNGTILPTFGANTTYPSCCIQYTPPTEVINFRDIYRFGYTNDLENVIRTGNNIDQYIAGLLILPIILGLLFIIWTGFLMIIKCCSCGQQRRGCISGSNMVISIGYDTYAAVSNKVRCVRFIFLLVSVCMLFALALFEMNGIYNFKLTLSSLYDASVDLAHATEVNAIYMNNISIDFVDVKNIYETKQVDTQLTNLCKNKLKINFGATKFQLFFQNWLSIANNGATLCADGGAALSQLNDIITLTQPALLTFLDGLSYSALYTLPLVFMTILFMLSCVMVWNGAPSIWLCFQNSILLPLFNIYIVASWTNSLVFLILAMANSDVCAGVGDPPSPMGTAQAFMETQGVVPNSTDVKMQLAYYAAMYYMGCNESFPFTFIAPLQGFTSATAISGNDLVTDISDAFLQSSNSQRMLLNSTNSSNVLIDGSCVTNELYTDLNNMVIILQMLVDLFSKLVQYITCDFLSPIYDQTVNVALCTHSPVALAWTATSLVAISICGFLMVSLRSAILPIVIVDSTIPDPDDDDDYDYGGNDGISKKSSPRRGGGRHPQSINLVMQQQDRNSKRIY